jgi:hypothetical protein
MDLLNPIPAGSERVRIRRTTSLSISTPNANEICWAKRGQPQRGFHRFIATTASYLVRSLGAGCRCSKVEGLKPMAERRMRVGRMKPDAVFASLWASPQVGRTLAAATKD